MFERSTVFVFGIFFATLWCGAGEISATVCASGTSGNAIQKYLARFDANASCTTCPFYAEDEPIVEKIGENEIVLRDADRLKTPCDARERFAKNRAAFADLFGRRLSCEDYFAKKYRTEAADFFAKIALIRELLSPKMKKLAPEISREQFSLALALVADMYSEWEFGCPEKRYGVVLKSQELDKDANFVYESARFLFVRQKYLQSFREMLFPIFRDEILSRSGNDPAKILAWLEAASPRFLGERSLSSRAVAAFLMTDAPSGMSKEKREKIADTSEKIEKYFEKMEEVNVAASAGTRQFKGRGEAKSVGESGLPFSVETNDFSETKNFNK